ncbi:MAG TPA: hypothetical protein VGT02_19845 [Methylomirabilota bacterium]|jgi:hypothetical protein|nr:hypothetical protein [Methylomirabilota bacterium]
MTQPVYIPLLDSTWGVLYPLLMAALSVVKGVVLAAIGVFVVVKLVKMAGRWRLALWVGAAVFFVVTVGSWLWSDYTALSVDATGIELRYATWPRPPQRLTFDQIESVSLSISGRRRNVRHLVIVTRPESAPGYGHWRSVAGSEEYIVLAIQWIEHASGGRIPIHRPHI